MISYRGTQEHKEHKWAWGEPLQSCSVSLRKPGSEALERTLSGLGSFKPDLLFHFILYQSKCLNARFYLFFFLKEEENNSSALAPRCSCTNQSCFGVTSEEGACTISCMDMMLSAVPPSWGTYLYIHAVPFPTAPLGHHSNNKTLNPPCCRRKALFVVRDLRARVRQRWAGFTLPAPGIDEKYCKPRQCP